MRCSKSLSRENGGAMVEAAISSFFLILLFGMAIDFMMLGYNAASLQFALNSTARWASLGNTLPDPAIPGAALSRLESIHLYTQRSGNALGIDVGGVRVCAGALPDHECTEAAGGPTDFMNITASVTVHSFFSGQQWSIERSTFARNEPFAGA